LARSPNSSRAGRVQGRFLCQRPNHSDSFGQPAAPTRCTAAGCSASTTNTIRHEVISRSRATTASRRKRRRIWTDWARSARRVPTPPTPCSSHPDVVKRCFALSGGLRHEAVHERRLRRQLPTSTIRSNYLANVGDPWLLQQLDVLRHPHRHPAREPFEHSGEAYSAVGDSREPRHSPIILERLGARLGGHDWPYLAASDAGSILR